MNLTWHLIKKDLIRLRVPLALFSLLVAGKIIFYAAINGVLGAPDLGWLNRLASGPELLLRSLVEPLFVYFLAGAMVFEDSPLTPDAHWITRPVSGGQLFGAKIAGATLALVLWPLFLNLGGWLACGCGWDDIRISAAEFATVDLFLVTFGLAIAALTDGYGRFVLWGLVGLGMFAMLEAFVIFGGGGGAEFSRLVVAAASGGLVASGVAGHQFVTRRHRRSLALVCGGVVLVGAITAVWRYNFMHDGPRRMAAEQPASAGVSVKLTGAARYHRVKAQHVAQLPFQIDGVPVTSLIGRVDVRGTWSFAGTAAWTSRITFTKGDWAQEAVRRLLGLKAPESEGRGTISLPFSRPMAERAAREPAGFHATVDIDFFRAKILAELPLREGTITGSRNYTISYLSSGVVPKRRPGRPNDAQPAPELNGFSLLLTERSAQGLRPNTRMSPVAGYYALVNRATGEIFPIDPVRSGPEATSLFNQVKVACWRLTFLTGDVSVQAADLTLAVVGFEEGESIRRELTVDRMPFAADSVEKPAASTAPASSGP